MSNATPLDLDLDRLLQSAAPEPAREQQRPHLRPVPRPAQRHRSPLISALVSVGIVLAVLAAQLGLSIAVSKGAYDLRALELEQRDLGRVESVLRQNVEQLASPQNLAENAARLGMVQNARPATIRLSDGAVLGALNSEAVDPQTNLVPNSTLESMPAVDAEGLLEEPASAAATSAEPVRLDGTFPAPETH